MRMDLRQALQPLMANVQFSSAASLFGAPGQGNYAAANAALEAHSAAASAMGMRQMAIQWGAWAAGMLGTSHQDLPHESQVVSPI